MSGEFPVDLMVNFFQRHPAVLIPASYIGKSAKVQHLFQFFKETFGGKNRQKEALLHVADSCRIFQNFGRPVLYRKAKIRVGEIVFSNGSADGNVPDKRETIPYVIAEQF